VKANLTTTLTVVDEVAVLDSTNVLTLIDELNEAKRAAKAAEERKDAADKAIRALLGDALIGTVDGAVRVELIPVVRNGVDTKMLRDLFPEAAEACATATEYTRLNTK